MTMNRREFFQTSTLFLAGSVCVGASLYTVKPTRPFRVQKIFLESWDAENVWEDSPRTTSFVQKKLESLLRNPCDGLLLVPGGRCHVGWMNKIVLEANNFDLKVFIPVCLTYNFLSNVRTAIPLSHKTGVLQSIEGSPVNNGGFLLLDRIGDVFGLVLYDSSRCLWTGFVSSVIDVIQNAESSMNDSRLMTAKWLDRVLLRGHN